MTNVTTASKSLATQATDLKFTTPIRQQGPPNLLKTKALQRLGATAQNTRKISFQLPKCTSEQQDLTDNTERKVIRNLLVNKPRRFISGGSGMMGKRMSQGLSEMGYLVKEA
jgi:hypothetical protein